MIWTIICCTILIIAGMIGSCFWIKYLLASSITEVERVVEDRLVNASDIPQVAIDNYIGEIVASVKSEIKDIKPGKKVVEKVAEDLRLALLEKLSAEYLKSKEAYDNTKE